GTARGARPGGAGRRSSTEAVGASEDVSATAVSGRTFTVGRDVSPRAAASRISLRPGVASERRHEHAPLTHEAATHSKPFGVAVKHSIEASDEDVEDFEMHGYEEHQRSRELALSGLRGRVTHENRTMGGFVRARGAPAPHNH